MFYLLEIYYRSLFYFFFNLFLLTTLYCNKELLVWFVVLPFNFNKKAQNSFIYTHPTELFNIIFYLLFFIAILINLIYIIFICLDFFKTSLNKTKFQFFQKLSFIVFLLILTFNLIFLFYIIPCLFLFFESYNNTTNFGLDLIMELRIESYVKFFIDSLIVSNFLFYFILGLLLLIFSFNFIFLLKNKKLLFLINILLATFFSPPDIISQLSLFCVLTFLVELIFLVLLFKLKFNMVAY